MTTRERPLVLYFCIVWLSIAILCALLAPGSAHGSDPQRMTCGAFGVVMNQICGMGAQAAGIPGTMDSVAVCNLVWEIARDDCASAGLPKDATCWEAAGRASRIVGDACIREGFPGCAAWALGVQSVFACGSDATADAIR
jgi:hypothetical protein